MTDVAFHFGAPNKLNYACRLLRKAVGSGAKVLVVADAVALHRLDADLWATSPTDFVAHCMNTADALTQQRSPVVLANQVVYVPAQLNVLVNLADEMPDGFEKFERVIEVVGTDDADRDLARVRWRQYTERGYKILRHDLALRGTS